MTEPFEYVGPLPARTEPAAPLLGKEARETMRRWLAGYAPLYDHETAEIADGLLVVLEPLVAALVAEQRKAERRKVADLLAEHAETLAAFAGDKADLVGLLALLLRLDAEPAS